MTEYTERVLAALVKNSEGFIYEGTMAELGEQVGNPTLLKGALETLTRTRITFKTDSQEANVVPLIHLRLDGENGQSQKVIAHINEYYTQLMEKGLKFEFND